MASNKSEEMTKMKRRGSTNEPRKKEKKEERAERKMW